jgi:hypothetical protein
MKADSLDGNEPFSMPPAYMRFDGHKKTSVRGGGNGG